MSQQKIIRLVERSYDDELSALTDEQLARLGELAVTL
jgi:hypothetical protein